MSIVNHYDFEAMIGDPDDHRPESTWSLVVDPGGPSGQVDDLAVIAERIAPGDRIPLHIHRVNEVILARGPGQFTLGNHTAPVDDGSVVFIPAGTPHGLRNDGDGVLPMNAVFPTTQVWMQCLERNPAPGTEDNPPQPGATYDFRTGTVEFDAR